METTEIGRNNDEQKAPTVEERIAAVEEAQAELKGRLENALDMMRELFDRVAKLESAGKNPAR
jgi:hypothetical protein